MQIGIGIVFVRWEVFAKYSQILTIFFLYVFSLFLVLYAYSIKGMDIFPNQSVILSQFTYIFNIKNTFIYEYFEKYLQKGILFMKLKYSQIGIIVVKL